MAKRTHLHNQRGQILIESVFLAVVVSAVLVIFKQLIEYQKSRQHFRFARELKEPLHVKKSQADIAK